MAVLRVVAVAMILFMISQNFYPHDRVLESQAWKKVVYAGGKVESNTRPTIDAMSHNYYCLFNLEQHNVTETSCEL